MLGQRRRWDWATLYTDASFDSPAAGVACWAASDYGRLIDSEPINGPVADVLIAELLAIRYGIGKIRAEWPDVTAIRVTSDSRSALGFLRGESAPAPSRGDVAELVDHIHSYRPDVFLKYVWVKGHQRRTTRPAYVNGRVDEMAYKAMREARRVLAQEGEA